MNGRLMADRFMSCPFRQADIQVKRPVSLSGLVEPPVNAVATVSGSGTNG